MKTLIAIFALTLSTHAFADDECVRVGEMYYSAAIQRDQAIPQEAVERNIRKNFAGLSSHYNLDVAVGVAFKHYDISPDLLQSVASAKCQQDRQ